MARTVPKNTQKGDGQPLLFSIFSFIFNMGSRDCIQLCCALHCSAYLEKDETLKRTSNHKITSGLAKM